ncbi:hypothetical protein Tco_1384717 [Tanacetum coccineum]
MWNSPAYKTYLAYATGAATPKKARKFKKLASPSKKRTLIIVEEEELKPVKKVVPSKKPSRKQSNDVPDKPKSKSIDTHEGTGLKPRVFDVCKAYYSKSKYESWGDSGDESNVQGDDEDVQDSDDDPQQADDKRTGSENQEINDDEEESNNEFVHTPEDYVPSNDETNDKDVDEEEYERINEELYGDVNVRLTDAKHNDEEKGDANMTDVAHVQVETQEQTTGVPEESVPEFETLSALHQRITDLEKDVKELQNVDNSTTVISTIKSKVLNAVKEYLGSSLDDALYKMIQKHSADIIKEHSVPAKIHARKQEVPKDTITSSGTVALEEFDQKPIFFNTMTKSKSFNKIPKHRALYHALMESILEDKDAIDKDQGLKRQRTSKGTKTSKKTSTLKDSSKGKSLTTSSKSGKSAKGEDLGKTDEQPNDEAVPNNDWYKKSRSDTSLDYEWNEGKLVDVRPEQGWLNELAKATKPPLTFDELMHTPIDLSAFAMNHLKINNLTKEHLVGPVYNLLKGTCKIYVELDYTMEECYHALSEQIDWNNPEGHHCPYCWELTED